MRSELFKTALQNYKDELAKCLQEGGEGKRVSAFLEKIDHQIPLSQHMFDVAWQYQQSKVDELQKQRDSFIKAYEIEMDKSVELQKRVDAAKQLIEDLNKCYQQDHQNKFEYWRGFADSAGILGKRLEQALKGGGE